MGLQDYSIPTKNASYDDPIRAARTIWNFKPVHSWVNAFNFLGGYLAGLGPDKNRYKAGDIRTLDMKQSVSANDIRSQLRSVGYRQGPIPDPTKTRRNWNGFSTFQGWLNIWREPTNGTQA